jgi:hypothetical protein
LENQIIAAKLLPDSAGIGNIKIGHPICIDWHEALEKVEDITQNSYKSTCGKSWTGKKGHKVVNFIMVFRQGILLFNFK